MEGKQCQCEGEGLMLWKEEGAIKHHLIVRLKVNLVVVYRRNVSSIFLYDL